MTIDKPRDCLYQTGAISVLETPSLDVLAACYLRAKAEGLLTAFFHELASPLDLPAFLHYCTAPGARMFAAIWQHTPDHAEYIGIGRVQPPVLRGDGHAKAEVAIFFFRQFQFRALTLPSCRLMLSLIFDRDPVLDVVYGSIPEHNQASRRFMRAIGFASLPVPIPHYTAWRGQACGMLVSWMTRGMWTDVLRLT